MNNKNIQGLKQLCKHDSIISYMKKHIKQINKSGAIKLALELLTATSTSDPIKISKEIQSSYLSLAKKNPTIIEKADDNKYYLKREVAKELSSEILTIAAHLEKTSDIVLVDKDNDAPWYKSQLIGKDIYELNTANTYQQMRECMCNEGNTSSFVFQFKNKNITPKILEEKDELQIVNLSIDSVGSVFGLPLVYKYYCDECDAIHERKEYTVSSTRNSIKCPNLVPIESEKGVKYKKCNKILQPDSNMTETKDFYISTGSIQKDGDNVKVSIISERKKESGKYIAAVFKLSSAYSLTTLCVIDVQEVEKQNFTLPAREQNKHYALTLIDGVEQHIQSVTGYKHYGYLPVKIGMLLQSAARYMDNFKRDFNIAIIGDRGSGKTTFAKYWSYTIYGPRTLNVNSGSLRVTKMRGTMEQMYLFGEKYNFLSKGYLGEKDNIVIDELAENKELKDDLKQFLREDKYSYAMQGATNERTTRTAQVITTENINVGHMSKYRNLVRTFYKSDECNIECDDPKPIWNESWDVQLPLSKLDNPYLQFAVNEVRNEYERKDINWIDGSSTSLSDRFPFFFLLSTENNTEDIYDIISENLMNDSVNNSDEELYLKLGADSLIDYFESIKLPKTGTNEKEYIKKVRQMLQRYKKLRTRSLVDCMNMLKILRMIDNRECYTEEDMRIVTYIVEKTDNKVYVSETNELTINGPDNITIPDRKTFVDDEDSLFYKI